MSGTKFNMTWQDVEECIDVLVGQFKDVGYEPKAIVGVAKGGVVPATLLHQVYPRATFHTIGVTSYTGIISGSVRFTQNCEDNIPDNTSTLIVDDILDSGATMEFLQTFFKASTFAFMTCRQKNAGKCHFRGRIYPEGWVDFPWERAVQPVEVPF